MVAVVAVLLDTTEPTEGLAVVVVEIQQPQEEMETHQALLQAKETMAVLERVQPPIIPAVVVEVLLPLEQTQLAQVVVTEEMEQHLLLVVHQ